MRSSQTVFKDVDFDLLSNLIATLPREVREAAQYYFIEYKTQKDIASILSLSPAVVKQRLNKGAYLIKKELKFPELEKARQVLYSE